MGWRRRVEKVEEEEEVKEHEDVQDKEVEAQRRETMSRKRGGDTTMTREMMQHLDTPTLLLGGSTNHNDDDQQRGWRPTTQSRAIWLCSVFFSSFF